MGERAGGSAFAEILPWEIDLIKKVAGAFRTADRDELEATLAVKLLELKLRAPAEIRDWKAYLAKFLYNKSSNWIRDTRARQRREETRGEGLEFVGSASVFSSEEHVAVARAWAELNPKLRRLWEMLVEEGGNQAAVARQLGIHRNTVRLQIEVIRKVLKRHGFVR